MQTFFSSHTVWQPQVAFMQQRHIADVVKIERLSFTDPWSRKDFMRVVKGNDNGQGKTGLAAFAIEIPTQSGMTTAGYVIGECCGPFYDLLNFAIHPDWRRKRIMFAVMVWIQRQCQNPRRPMLRTLVSEESLETHLFLWSCNFRMVRVARKLNGENDFYEFRWDMREDDILETPRARNVFQMEEQP